MTDWLYLDSSELNKIETTTKNGVKTTRSFSSYDIPIALRADKRHQDGKDWIVIEFKYVNDDHPRPPSGTEQAKLAMGASSGRVMELWIPFEEAKRPGFTLAPGLLRSIFKAQRPPARPTVKVPPEVANFRQEAAIHAYKLNQEELIEAIQ